MSARLDAVCSLIGRTEVLADVGCDHAYVAEYCVERGLASSVIASDISENCLQKARSRLSGAENVKFVCCDGIQYKCDTAVIAGMGGKLICEILQNAEALPKTLILCPHRNAECLRSELLRLGYGIDKDFPIEDRGKFYSVIRAVKDGGLTELNELQIYFGVDCAKKSEALERHLKALYNAYMKAPNKNAQQLRRVTAALKFQGDSAE